MNFFRMLLGAQEPPPAVTDPEYDSFYKLLGSSVKALEYITQSSQRLLLAADEFTTPYRGFLSGLDPFYELVEPGSDRFKQTCRYQHALQFVALKGKATIEESLLPECATLVQKCEFISEEILKWNRLNRLTEKLKADLEHKETRLPEEALIEMNQKMTQYLAQLSETGIMLKSHKQQQEPEIVEHVFRLLSQMEEAQTAFHQSIALAFQNSASVPLSSNYGHELALEKGEETLEIEPGNRRRLQFRLRKDEALHWLCLVTHDDVGYEVSYTVQRTTTVVSPSRKVHADHVHHDSFCAPEDCLLSILFDNSYSILTSKTLSVHYGRLEDVESLNEEELAISMWGETAVGREPVEEEGLEEEGVEEESLEEEGVEEESPEEEGVEEKPIPDSRDSALPPPPPPSAD